MIFDVQIRFFLNIVHMYKVISGGLEREYTFLSSISFTLCKLYKDIKITTANLSISMSYS